jgi:hypothetical protein
LSPQPRPGGLERLAAGNTSPDAAATLRYELLAALPPIPFPLPFGFAVSSAPGTIRDRTTLFAAAHEPKQRFVLVYQNLPNRLGLLLRPTVSGFIVRPMEKPRTDRQRNLRFAAQAFHHASAWWVSVIGGLMGGLFLWLRGILTS